MSDRDFFFGLFRVNWWNYLWGYTAAQIELATIDAPLVVYADKDGKFNDVSADDIKEASDKWLNKYGGENKGKKINLSDLLNKKA